MADTLVSKPSALCLLTMELEDMYFRFDRETFFKNRHNVLTKNYKYFTEAFVDGSDTERFEFLRAYHAGDIRDLCKVYS